MKVQVLLCLACLSFLVGKVISAKRSLMPRHTVLSSLCCLQQNWVILQAVLSLAQAASPPKHLPWVAGQHAGGGPSAHQGSAGTGHTEAAEWAAAVSADGRPPAMHAVLLLMMTHCCK